MLDVLTETRELISSCVATDRRSHCNASNFCADLWQKLKLRLLLICAFCIEDPTTYVKLLFSAQISYGKGKDLSQTDFLQHLSSTKFIFNFKGV